MTIFDSILGGGTDLISYSGTETLVEVLGYDTAYDGGGGFFIWVATADLPAATIQLGGFFFDSTSLTGGKWVRKEFYEEVPFMNVKWWGAKGDNATVDTAAIQSAFDFYNPMPTSTSDKVFKTAEIFFPTGIYRIDETLNYITYGNNEGIKIRGEGTENTSINPISGFDGDSIINIDGSVLSGGTSYMFQKGGYISEIQINGLAVTPISPNTVIHGLRLTGWWNFVINNIKVYQCTGNGIYLPSRTDISSNPDFYTVIGEFKDCTVEINDGWGWNSEALQASAGCKFFNNIIESNKGGGIHVGSTNILIQNGSIAYNGDGSDSSSFGLHFYYGQNCRVSGVEFDTNANNEIFIENLFDSQITCNRFLYNYRSTPLYPNYDISHYFITIGKTGSFVVNNIQIDKNWYRLDDTLASAPTSGTYKGIYIPYPTPVTNLSGNNDVFNDNNYTLTVYDYSSGFEIINNYTFDYYLNSGINVVSRGLPNPLFIGLYTGTPQIQLGTIGVNLITIDFTDDGHGLNPWSSCYSSGIFTCPLIGFYTISFSIAIDNLACDQQALIAVFVNGDYRNMEFNGRSSNGTTFLNGTISHYASINDEIFVRAATSTGNHYTSLNEVSRVSINMM